MAISRLVSPLLTRIGPIRPRSAPRMVLAVVLLLALALEYELTWYAGRNLGNYFCPERLDVGWVHCLPYDELGEISPIVTGVFLVAMAIAFAVGLPVALLAIVVVGFLVMRGAVFFSWVAAFVLTTDTYVAELSFASPRMGMFLEAELTFLALACVMLLVLSGRKGGSTADAGTGSRRQTGRTSTRLPA